MKRAAPLAALLLFACGEADQPNQLQRAAEAPPMESVPTANATAAEPLSLECAVGGAAFARACLVEQAEGEDGVTLTIRHPDGGFRRLVVTPAGEIAPADGAEPADNMALEDGRVEVGIGNDRYRIPAPAPAGAGARPGQ